MADLPEFEERDAPSPRGAGRQAAALLALFLVVAAAVVTGILLTWAAVQPVLPPAPTPSASATASTPR